VKFYSVWQPVRNEDALTAMTFGFLRHAPVEHGLTPWFTDALGRAVSASGLAVSDFWPSHWPAAGTHTRTEPDLAVLVSDGHPLLVIVEAKLDFGGHGFEQIRREVIDAAAHTGRERIELVMVGADRGAPAVTHGWEDRLKAELVGAGLGHVQAKLRYCSWARLGRFIDACAMPQRAPDWRTYANDVLYQMRERGLLGYNGGPMTSDLDELTAVNAVKVFNRIVTNALQLLRDLTGSPRFTEAGYTAPNGTQSFWMGRDAYSEALNAPIQNYITRMLFFAARKPHWPAGSGVFVAFDLAHPDELQLEVGAYHYAVTGAVTSADAYANSHPNDPRRPALAGRDRAALPEASADGTGGEWVYAMRPWRESEDPDGDINWVLDRLDDAERVWDTAAGA
jgi:hypothetical protein